MQIIVCPNCGKKLKAKSIPQGKKVKCPACSQAFRADVGNPDPQSGDAPAAPVADKSAASERKAASAGKKSGSSVRKSASDGRAASPTAAKKKRPPTPAPASEDFVDFDDDGMYDEGDLYDEGDPYDDQGEYDEPAGPARRKSAASGRTSKKGGAKSKRGAAKPKSRAPLFIGIGVLVAVLAGVGIFIAVTRTGSEPAMADAGAAGDSDQSDTEGAGDAESGTTSAAAEPETQPAATQIPAAGAAATSSGATAAGLNVQWLPAGSELIVGLDVQRLLASPLQSILPMLGPQIQQMKEAVGFGPEAIGSVTVGVAGISEMVTSGKPPGPESLLVAVVIRMNSSVDMSKIVSLIPDAEEVSAGATKYVRFSGADESGAIWMADSTTAVVGSESWVKTLSSYSGPPNIDASLVSGDAVVRVAFAPKNPEAVFRSAPVPARAPRPDQQILLDVAKVIQPTVTGVGLGVDITNDLTITGAIQCKDSQGAKASAEALEKLIEQARQMQQQMAQSGPSGGGIPGMDISRQADAALKTFKTAVTDNTASFSIAAPNGGMQLGAVAPMMGPMIQQSFAVGQSAGRRIVAINNLKQIMLSMHNFHDEWSRFPNATPKRDDGTPLLSWRVHLLPYLGQQELYDRFNVDEPWDSETNRPLIDLMPDVYAHPDVDLETGMTVYQIPVGPGTMFEGGVGRAIRDCTDGTSNTIGIVITDAAHAVIWTKPEDLAWDPQNPTAGLLSTDEGSIMVALLDGSVQQFDAAASPDLIKLLFTRADGQLVPRELLRPAIRRGPGAPQGQGF